MSSYIVVFFKMDETNPSPNPNPNPYEICRYERNLHRRRLLQPYTAYLNTGRSTKQPQPPQRLLYYEGSPSSLHANCSVITSKRIQRSTCDRIDQDMPGGRMVNHCCGHANLRTDTMACGIAMQLRQTTAVFRGYHKSKDLRLRSTVLLQAVRNSRAAAYLVICK